MSPARTALAAALLLGPAAAAPAQPKPAGPPKLALLVGCTTYPNHPQLRSLFGPANDVKLWRELLTTGFGFADADIATLAGWPDAEAQRPTKANIAKGFEALVARAEPGSRVVIVLSGHGVQVPIPEAQKNPLAPNNPEPDGMDEVFLPADVGPWDPATGLKDAILDDEIGRWLDKLREKGAHVLAVFDCCHSGTMTRGGPDGPDPTVREVARTADRAVLGVKPEQVDAAVKRAAEAVAAAKKAGQPLPGEATVAAKNEAKGSLVAFYAAQPFEEAPELPLPEGMPIAREHYYGMLTFTLVGAIKQRASGLSYAELQRLVAAEYRSARPTKPPTPFAEGDLTREVLGLTDWPNRPAIDFDRPKKGPPQVSAGALHGLTKGSVLSVAPLGAGAAVVGHVRVESVAPASATVVPVEFDGKPAVAADALPAQGRCEVVLKDFGDLRVKVFTDSPAVAAALGKLEDGPKGMIQAVAEPDAEWVLRVVTPAQAAAEFNVKDLKADQVFLVHGSGQARDPKGPAPKHRKVFGQYPAGDEKALAGALGVDLPKIFTWQNVWRVAGGMSAADGGKTHDVKVEVVKLANEKAADGEVLRDGVLKDGQEVLVRARNGGREKLWVAAFYLDANLQIVRTFSDGVDAGQTITLWQAGMTVEGNSAGLEGVVVFAVPQAAVEGKPNFDVILQGPLKVADQGKGGAGERGKETPFQQLLAGAAVNKGTAGRGGVTRVSSTPAILSQSWVLVP